MTRPSSPPPPASYRMIGMAMLGSAVALAVLAALVYAGALPFAATVRGWVAAGAATAAGLDAVIGLYFLRASSQS